MREPAHCLVEDGEVVGIQDRLHRRNFRMAAKRLHGAENHALPANGALLFGAAGAGTKTASGCDEDGGGPLRIRHRSRPGAIRQFLSWVDGALPLSRSLAKTERFFGIPSAVGKSTYAAVHLQGFSELSKV